VVNDVVGCEGALHVVAPTDAENVREALLSEQRIGRARAHHENTPVVVDPRGWDRGARTPMPVDEDDSLPGELIGDLDRHLRVAACIVSNNEGKLLAVDTAALVDVVHCQLSGALQLLTERRVLRGHRGNAHRTDDGDPDFSSQDTRSEGG